jgi:hypothetical protein
MGTSRQVVIGSRERRSHAVSVQRPKAGVGFDRRRQIPFLNLYFLSGRRAASSPPLGQVEVITRKMHPQGQIFAVDGSAKSA